MARPVSDEELQLRKRARRRLIGAIVVVTAVAVGLPMVLDHEPKSVGQEISVQIPSPESGAFKSKVVPLAPDSKPQSRPAAKPEVAPPPKVATAPAPKPEPPAAAKPAAKDVARPVPQEPPKPAAKEPAKPVAKPAVGDPSPAVPAAEAFVVQVAALADVDKAKALQDTIARTGLKTYTEVVAIAKGNVTRVRVGPYASREAAEKAREQLKGIGLDGKVVPK